MPTIIDGTSGITTAALDVQDSITVKTIVVSSDLQAEVIRVVQSFEPPEGYPVSNLRIETDPITTDYTLSSSDVDKVVLFAASTDVVLTVPNSSDESFELGSMVYVYNNGDGFVSIAEGSDVTVRNFGDVAQYSEVSLRKRDENEWVLSGDINFVAPF